MEFFDILNSACEDTGIEFTEDKYNKFIKYMRLVQEWNEKINLTAIVEDNDFIKKHFVDCIKAFKSNHIKEAKSVIDVGTGAGFPGIPIAILNDDCEVLLLDSLNKRVNFLNLVIKELNLKNVKTIHSRAEDGARNPQFREKFDVATSRAVANMAVLSEFCLPFVKNGGYFIALKGPSIEEELDNGKNAIKKLGGNLENIIQVTVEGTDLMHNVVEVKKISDCPKAYPRKAGTITKKPLK